MSKKHITVPVFIPHTGCPHTCAFCNQWQTSNAGKIPNENDILETVDIYLANADDNIYRELAFFGGSFTGIPVNEQIRYLSTAMELSKQGKIQGIRLSTRPDYIDNEILDRLESFGVTTIELGAQSFDEDVLKLSKRGHSIDDIIESAHLIKSRGFQLGIQLMPGLPGDSFKKSVNSANMAADLKPSCARIYPTVVLENTELEVMYSNGVFTPLTLDEAVAISAEIYRILTSHDIDIIRMGLHPFAPEQENKIISGPYHTAFGFLVKSYIKKNILETTLRNLLITNKTQPNEIHIILPEKEKEEYIGMKKQNIEYLKTEFNLKKITISFACLSLPLISF